MNMNTQNQVVPAQGEEIQVIYSYTRKQALADGFQVEVTEMAAEAGFKFPVYVNRTVWAAYVQVPEGVSGQDEKGRLWDVLWMMRMGLRSGNQFLFQLYVRNTNGRPRKVTLKAMCGPKDIDDASPAITIMLPDED